MAIMWNPFQGENNEISSEYHSSEYHSSEHHSSEYHSSDCYLLSLYCKFEVFYFSLTKWTLSF